MRSPPVVFASAQQVVEEMLRSNISVAIGRTTILPMTDVREGLDRAGFSSSIFLLTAANLRQRILHFRQMPLKLFVILPADDNKFCTMGELSWNVHNGFHYDLLVEGYHSPVATSIRSIPSASRKIFKGVGCYFLTVILTLRASLRHTVTDN